MFSKDNHHLQTNKRKKRKNFKLPKRIKSTYKTKVEYNVSLNEVSVDNPVQCTPNNNVIIILENPYPSPSHNDDKQYTMIYIVHSWVVKGDEDM